MILQNSIWPAIILWFVVVVYYFLKHRSWKFKKFNFSPGHYYIMMSPLLAGLLITSWQQQSFRPGILFLVFAFSGIIGELLADAWWQHFYPKGLWIYKVETVYHRYTSWLNFLPWAVGGFLYFSLAAKLTTNQTFPGIIPIATITLIASVFLQLLIFNIFKPTSRFKYQNATWFSIVVVFLPIVFTVMILAWIFGPIIYQLALGFAIVGTIAEYLFGKASQLFISKKLWDYTYWSVDNGHFTPLSIPLFCIGGFYFWIIGVIFQQYLK